MALLVGGLLVGGFYALSYGLTAQSVTLVIEGARSEVRTRQPTVAALLDELGIGIEAQDVLSPPGDSQLVNGLRIEIDRANRVALEVDGQMRHIRTRHNQPAAILAEAGVVVGPQDAVYVDSAMWSPLSAPLSAPPRIIRIQRAIPLVIDDEGQTQTVFTAASTVGEALHRAGIALYLADRVTPPVEAPIRADTPIRIRRAVPVSVQVDGATLTIRSRAETVGAALAEAGLGLVGLDYSLPPDTDPLAAGMRIRVVRVTEEDEIHYSEIAYRQIVRPDTNLPPQTRAIIQPGIPGLMERRIRIRREDGVEVSRSLPEESILREPRDEIVAIGATPVLVTPATP